jgi:hypothetical protein
VGKITRPGEYFGEMSSLLNQERTATVTSLGRSVVQVFPGENLEATLCANPELAKKIIDIVKSPSAALHCILTHCSVPVSTPHSFVFVRLASESFYFVV